MQGVIVAVEDKNQNIFGLQYHPEVVHSERGFALLKRFVLDVAKVIPDWGMKNVLEEQSKLILQKVGKIPRLIP